MKNNEEFRNAVFEKVRIYEEKRKKKRQTVLRITSAAFSCLVFAFLVVMIPLKTVIRNNKTDSPVTAEPTLISGDLSGETAKHPTNTDSSVEVSTTGMYVTTEPYTTATYSSTTGPAMTESTSVVYPPYSDFYFFNEAALIRKDYSGSDEKVSEYILFSSYKDFSDSVTESENEYILSATSWLERNIDNSFLYATLNFGSGSIRPAYSHIMLSNDGKTATVYINYIIPSVGTDDMGSWALVIPLFPREAENIEEVSFVFNAVNLED